MIKALSALAIAAFCAAAITLLPGFAPAVEAGATKALPKADRLNIKPSGTGCSSNAWPHFEATCLRQPGVRTPIMEARLITTTR